MATTAIAGDELCANRYKTNSDQIATEHQITHRLTDFVVVEEFARAARIPCKVDSRSKDARLLLQFCQALPHDPRPRDPNHSPGRLCITVSVPSSARSLHISPGCMLLPHPPPSSSSTTVLCTSLRPWSHLKGLSHKACDRFTHVALSFTNSDALASIDASPSCGINHVFNVHNFLDLLL